SSRRPHLPRGLAAYGGGLGVYGAVPYAVAPLDESLPQAAPTATGMVRLLVTPDSAQVFVDSYYVATIADLGPTRVLTLATGPHPLVFRTAVYTPLTVDLQVTAHDVITYRGDLERRAPAPPVRPAGVSTNPIYVIPNCYLGNIPPRPSRLPAGCNIA